MDSIRVVQLSDCHLFGDSNGRLMGVNTRSSFEAVLGHVMTEVDNPDLIVITGDLTQDDSRASYEWLRQQLDKTTVPYYWTAGNHDITELMIQVCPDAMNKYLETGNWQLLFLDSHQEGMIPGQLATTELDFLQHKLEQNPNRHTLIAFHHPPYTINSPWLDDINLQNSEDFWQRIEQASNVRGIINGHIHQQQDWLRGDIRVLSAPSTAIQFKPESPDFCLDQQPPGYRVLDLLPDGRIETQVVRLNNYLTALDMEASGY